jgi:hypothetical protein
MPSALLGREAQSGYQRNLRMFSTVSRHSRRDTAYQHAQAQWLP